MLSMPPATSTSWLPAFSMSCANIAARMPEPHIFDKVTAPALFGRPPLNAAWRAGRLALAGHQAVAEQHFGDQLGPEPRAGRRALHRGLDRRAAQVVRGQRREVALKTAHRGAGGADDDDRVVRVG